MDFVRPQGVIDADNARRGSARERASAQGWNIDPEASPGNQHEFGTKCTDTRCPCHGKTFVAYRRGA